MRQGSLAEQTRCLQSEAGAKFMSMFDGFPPQVRERARLSPFNLCAACICDVADQIAGEEHGAYARFGLDDTTLTKVYLRAIDRMERWICEELETP